MNRTRGRLVAATIAVGLALTGCKAGSTSLYVGGVMDPPTVTSGTACGYTASATGPFVLQSTVDVVQFAGTVPTYEPVVLVANQLQETSSPTQLRVETSRVILQDAVVYVSDGEGNQVSAFTTPVSGEIDPASGSSPSYGVSAILLIDGTAGAIIGQQVVSQGANQRAVAKFKLQGVTLGGDSVESAYYYQAVDFCIGCLTELVPVAGCSSSSTASTDVPCEIGQDQSASCCNFSFPYCSDQNDLPSFDAGIP